MKLPLKSSVRLRSKVSSRYLEFLITPHYHQLIIHHKFSSTSQSSTFKSCSGRHQKPYNGRHQRPYNGRHRKPYDGKHWKPYNGRHQKSYVRQAPMEILQRQARIDSLRKLQNTYLINNLRYRPSRDGRLSIFRIQLR